MKINPIYFRSFLLPVIAIVVFYPPIQDLIFQYIPPNIYYFFITFSISFGLLPFFHKVGLLLDITDKPGGRHLHRKITPVTGGLPIFIAFVSTTYLTVEIPPEFHGLFWGSVIILIIGIIDDISPISAIWKISGQIIAVTILIKYKFLISFFPDNTIGNILSIFLTYVWILGIINAFNCLDGLDGLASGVGIIISFFFCMISINYQNTFMLTISLILSGAILGFFPYNFRGKAGAQIFLGDNGSTFIGFLLASFSVYGNWGINKSVDIVIPILLLGVPITDMILTTVLRFYHKEVKNFYELLGYTGSDHLHHRLKKIGLSSHLTVFVFYLLTAIMGLLSLLLKHGNIFESFIAIFIAFLLFFLFSISLITLDKIQQ